MIAIIASSSGKDSVRTQGYGGDTQPRRIVRSALRGPRTVLVVEDHADSLRMLRQMVEYAGPRAVTAGHGHQALAVLNRTAVHLILCDLRMPVMDGFELVRRIRQDPRLFRIPVIAVSALGSDDDYRRTLEAGFSGRLVKPITFGVVAAQLRRVFSSQAN